MKEVILKLTIAPNTVKIIPKPPIKYFRERGVSGQYFCIKYIPVEEVVAMNRNRANWILAALKCSPLIHTNSSISSRSKKEERDRIPNIFCFIREKSTHKDRINPVIIAQVFDQFPI